jgi:response regulator of citrate/malate metabolism
MIIIDDMPRDIEKNIINLISRERYGLTIDEVSTKLDINRTTASKYLFALRAQDIVVVRDVGKAKLHYMKKYFRKDA